MLNGFNLFQSCAGCGTSIGVRDSLCATCTSELHAYPAPSSSTLPAAIKTFSLFTWNLATDSISRPLIYSLKGAGNPRLRKHLARLAAKRLLAWDPHIQDREWAIPPTHSHQINHARALAEDISRELRLEKDIIELAPDGDRPQKASLGRAERRQLQFKDFGHSAPKVIVIDDVITTGATMEAAYRALREPSDFVGFTLWVRAKLAESQQF